MDMRDRVNPLDIKIGSRVRCRDGRAGRVLKLVVEPSSKRMTHVIVERGVLLHHDVAVPIERVERVQDGWVVLDLSVEGLSALPAYAEVDDAVPDATWAAEHGYPPDGTLVDLRSTAPGGLLAPAWSGLLIQGHTHAGVPAEETPVGRGTRVTYREGALGRLDDVLLEPETGVVPALVVRKGRLLAKDVIVPAAWVERVGEDEIVVDADRALLERLPEYKPARSDAAITADVREALGADPRTRDEAGIDARTRDGVVHLGGAVRAEDAKRVAAEVARGVPGVWDVADGSTAESAVAAAGAALARAPRTARAVIDVAYQSGGVTLRGQVRTPQEKAAAVEVAQGVPGVATVVDELEVRAEAARKSWPAAAEESLLAAAGRVRPS